MVNTVKKIRARRDILKITKKQDYFIISDIYHGDSDCERKSRLLTSLLQLNNPCATNEQLDNHYTYFEEKVRELKLDHCNADLFLMSLLPELEEYTIHNLQGWVLSNRRHFEQRKGYICDNSIKC